MYPKNEILPSLSLQLPSSSSSLPPLNNRTNGIKYNQIITAVIACWLSLIQGYASAYYSPAEHTMNIDLNLTDDEGSWISSLLPVGAFIGCLLGGGLIEHLGRRTTLILVGFIFLLGFFINYKANNYWDMYYSRIILGFSVGLTSLTLPVYLTEIVHEKIRGRLGLLPTILGNFGILFCFIVSIFFNWKQLGGVGVPLQLPFLLLTMYIPETPHWYILNNKLLKANIVSKWLRGYEINDEDEFTILDQGHGKKYLSLFKSKPHFRALSIVLILMYFQQFCGINAIIFYTRQIFEASNTTIDVTICTIIIGSVNFLSTFIATIFIDKLGRKFLLYLSAIIMLIQLGILSFYFYAININLFNMQLFNWIPITSFVLYIIAFSFGFGPIPWLMMGEILPASIRGHAASICSAFNWACTFFITKTFPLMVTSVGLSIILIFFLINVIFSIFFIKFFVPETRKKSLRQIENIILKNY